MTFLKLSMHLLNFSRPLGGTDVKLTHHSQHHLPAADARDLLHLALVRPRVSRLERQQVDGGIAVLGVRGEEVDAVL